MKCGLRCGLLHFVHHNTTRETANKLLWHYQAMMWCGTYQEGIGRNWRGKKCTALHGRTLIPCHLPHLFPNHLLAQLCHRLSVCHHGHPHHHHHHPRPRHHQHRPTPPPRHHLPRRLVTLIPQPMKTLKLMTACFALQVGLCQVIVIAPLTPPASMGTHCAKQEFAGSVTAYEQGNWLWRCTHCFACKQPPPPPPRCHQEVTATTQMAPQRNINHPDATRN